MPTCKKKLLIGITVRVIRVWSSVMLKTPGGRTSSDVPCDWGKTSLPEKGRGAPYDSYISIFD